MGFIAKDNGGGDFKKVPPGAYIGRCYSLIDLGTQFTDGQYGPKAQYKIRLGWELFGEDETGAPLTIDVNGKEMPMTISKSYTLSMSEKANLRKDLAAWRGKAFTDEEAKEFDVSKLLGAFCMVNVTTNEKNGKTYTNVAGLTPIPGVLKNSKPTPVHDNLTFTLDEPDFELLESFHDKLKEAIKRSPEYQQITGKKPEQPAQVTANPASSGFEDMDDDIPF
mgnify:CR=1 FL=1